VDVGAFSTKSAARPNFADLRLLHRSARTIERRLRTIGTAATSRLMRRGFVRISRVFGAQVCAALRALFDDDGRFDRTIEMAHRGFGVGTYRYFREPPPEPVRTLRRVMYRRLRGAAEASAAGGDPSRVRPRSPRFPASITGFHRLCRAVGQRRGSSILLRYGEGGINHPHRDLYGSVRHPFQAVVVLSRRGRDFEGGTFFLLEEGTSGERIREVPAGEGDLVIFASESRIGRVDPGSDRRPLRRDSNRGRRRDGRAPRVAIRHGMTVVRRGERYALGVVFHLAS
jgi:hypothetical protein